MGHSFFHKDETPVAEATAPLGHLGPTRAGRLHRFHNSRDLSYRADICGPVKQGGRGSKDHRAEQEHPGSEGQVHLRGHDKHLPPLESNGKMHTFIVAYDQYPKTLVIDLRKEDMITDGNVSLMRKSDAPTLEEVAGGKQALYHIGARKYGIMILCENIISYSDMTYIVLSLENRSSVSYNITDGTFLVESKKRSKRSVVFEQTFFPKNRFGSLSTGAGQKQIMIYSLDKQTLSENQVIKVYLYEEEDREILR